MPYTIRATARGRPHGPSIVLVGLTAAALFIAGIPCHAQQTTGRLSVEVMTSAGMPLQAVEVRSGEVAALTGSTGVATLTLLAGPRRVYIARIGFATDTLDVRIRAGQDTSVTVRLTPVAEQLAPLVVTATRVERRVEDQSERVEVLAQEDIQEKSFTSPGGLSNLLVEMGGVRIQPLAPGIGGAAVRLQGLPGRYTLLLVDGLPSYGARAPALGLVQVPPLDLSQVEVLKGAASALYGPNAAGGVVDLISKRPGSERKVLASASSNDGQDLLAWLSERLSPAWGYTLLGGAHRQDARDGDGDGWSELPGYRRAELRLRGYRDGRDGSVMLTVGGLAENRRGGTVAGGRLPYGGEFHETLNTRHVDAGVYAKLELHPAVRVGLRASAGASVRGRVVNAVRWDDHEDAELAEATLHSSTGGHALIAGAAAQRDAGGVTALPALSYRYDTFSLFAGDAYDIASALSLSGTLRLDHHSRFGAFLSPRVSALYRLAPDWSVRASAAAGYFAPTPLPPDLEVVDLSRFQPVDALCAEPVISASLDFSGRVGPLQATLTGFLTRIRHPLLPSTPADSGRYTLVQSGGALRTAGVEAFAVYAREPVLITATWSHTMATALAPGEPRRTQLPLTPRNSGGIDVAWEEDEPGESGLRVALEAFYTGSQRLDDDPYRSRTPGFATVEALISKRVGSATVFVDAENLTGVRQTHWDPLLRPAPAASGRPATEEWAPLEGRTFRVGVEIEF